MAALMRVDMLCKKRCIFRQCLNVEGDMCQYIVNVDTKNL